VGSVAIRRSYKWGDMRINPETYQKLYNECCSRGEVSIIYLLLRKCWKRLMLE